MIGSSVGEESLLWSRDWCVARV